MGCACHAYCWRCWRCGEPTHGFFPHFLCEPCLDVVTPSDLAWVNDPANQPGRLTWDMEPLGRDQGR